MSWIRSKVVFEDRMRLLYVSRRVHMGEKIMRLVDEFSDHPQLLSDALLGIIESARPELKGCLLHYMGFGPQSLCFEMLVSHSSFAPVPLAAVVTREPLFKEEGVTYEAPST